MFVPSVLLRVQIKMGSAVVTVKIMPDNPEVDLAKIEEESKKIILEVVGESDMKVSQEPVAFGLTSLNIIFVMDENKGSTEELEAQISNLEGVNSVECTDVRRAVG